MRVRRAGDGGAGCGVGIAGGAAVGSARGSGREDGDGRLRGWRLAVGAGDAALLRVTSGAAQVMVTVYQEAGSTREAPKLQVLRVSEAGVAPPPAPPPEPIEAMAHVYGVGDVGGRFGAWIGERGSRRWIEGFALQSLRLTMPGELEYQAVLGRGWLSPWADAGQFCGSRGMSLPVLGLNVRLRGAAAAAFEVEVSATFVDGTVVGPVRDGPCEAPSLAALEAFQVMLLPKEALGR